MREKHDGWSLQVKNTAQIMFSKYHTLYQCRCKFHLSSSNKFSSSNMWPAIWKFPLTAKIIKFLFLNLSENWLWQLLCYIEPHYVGWVSHPLLHDIQAISAGGGVKVYRPQILTHHSNLNGRAKYRWVSIIYVCFNAWYYGRVVTICTS